MKPPPLVIELMRTALTVPAREAEYLRAVALNAVLATILKAQARIIRTMLIALGLIAALQLAALLLR